MKKTILAAVALMIMSSVAVHASTDGKKKATKKKAKTENCKKQSCCNMSSCPTTTTCVMSPGCSK